MKTQNGWKASFSEKVKERYLNKMKKTEDGEVLKLRSPKELGISGKPNSPTSENINSINQNVPCGHSPRSAATTRLMQHVIPRVTLKKNSSFMIVMGLHDNQRIGGQLMELMKYVKDEHTSTDEVISKMSPRSTHVPDENNVAIQCLQ